MGKNNELKNITSESLIIAYLELLSDTEVNKITISSICEKAGVSRMGFYRHFKTKELLLEHHFNLEISNLVLKCNELKYNSSESLELFFNSIKEGPYLKKIISDRIVQDLVYKTLKNHLKSLLKIDDSIDKYTFDFICGGLFMNLLNWLEDESELSSDKLTNSIISSIVKLHKHS